MSPGVTPPSSPSTPSVTSSLPSTAPSSPEDLRLSGEALPVIHYLGTVFSSKSETPVRASRSEEIDEYNPKGVAQFLVDRFKDPQQILAVMNKLMKNDERYNGANPLFVLHKENVTKITDYLENLSASTLKPVKKDNDEYESERLVDGERADSPSQKQAKFEATVASMLVGCCVVRNIVSLPFSGEGNIQQIAGHVQRDGLFISGLASSEEPQKKMEVSHPANTAYILCGDKVLCSRSSRTDTPEKILEKSLMDISGRLGTQGKDGLVKASDGEYYIYQRNDVTLMDTSRLKAIATSAVSAGKSFMSWIAGKGTKPIESERQFVADKRKAARELFAKSELEDKRGRYIEHKFHLNGKETVVREYEPRIFNFVFSGQAKDPKNIENARIDNIVPTLDLFKKYIEKSDGDLKKYIPFLGEKKALQEILKFDLEPLNPKGIKDNDLRMALRAVLVSMTGRDENGHNYDTMDDCDSQFLLIHHLADMAKSPISVECKSGNDRTATATALICAQNEYKAIYGKVFDPVSSVNSMKFRILFTKYIEGFATPNLIASRGIGSDGRVEIKTGTSPVFLKNAITEQLPKLNIQGLLRHDSTVDDEEIDV